MSVFADNNAFDHREAVEEARRLLED